MTHYAGMSTWIARIWRGRRLDRNPLRRPSDRAETLVGGWLLVMLAVLAPLVAHGAATETQRIAQHARVTALATEHQVTATTLRTAPPAVTTLYSVTDAFGVGARWLAPDGKTRTGQIQVDASAPRGTRERIWVNGSGDVAPPPLPAGQVSRLAGQAAWISVPVLIVVFLALAALIRLVLRRRRLAAWDAEWTVIGPKWNRQPW